MSTFDAMEAGFHADPYPTYRQLRDNAPVLWYPEMGFWLLTRYEDVAAAIRNPELFSHESFWDEPVSHHDASDQRQAHVVNSFSQMMMYRDGDVHARMRRQAKHTFAPKQIKRSRESIERICRALLEGCREQGTFNYARDFAMLLPSLVIADYMGIPMADREEIRELVDRFSIVFEPLLPEEDRRAMLIDTVALCDYLDELIVARRKDPQDDFVSLLVNSDESEGKMSVDEIRGNLMHFLIAGNETTTNLLQHLIVVLSERPGVRERISANPDLIGPCVEETLRYEAPIQLTGRKLTRDHTIHGCDVPAGALIGLVIASANHDERKFDHPDVFDIDRPNSNQHHSLGAGQHFCIGAPLARLEGAIATELLTTEFTDLVTDPSGPAPVWKKDQLLRGYTHLQVTSSRVAQPIAN